MASYASSAYYHTGVGLFSVYLNTAYQSLSQINEKLRTFFLWLSPSGAGEHKDCQMVTTDPIPTNPI